MPQFADRSVPSVFISFAGPDRGRAEVLADDLARHGVRGFVDDREIHLGANVVLAIDKAMRRSDYCVLLWSAHALDRPHVDAEWSAAFAREIQERRAFLFVLRLDDSPLPPLLAPRKYLTAADGWADAVDRLAAVWRADLALRVPVLPQPAATPTAGMTVYLRNRALKVAHTVTADPSSTGAELLEVVRAALALPDSESRFGGQVGLRFTYRLLIGEEPLPDKPLSELGIADGDVVDVEIRADPFGPDGPHEGWTMRADAPVRRRLLTTMVRSAFRHLAP